VIYNLSATDCFLKQIELLDNKTKRILEQKLILTKQNPYRNKRLKGYKPLLFRIRIAGKRITYLIENNTINLICILDRKNNYQDLDKYLYNIGS